MLSTSPFVQTLPCCIPPECQAEAEENFLIFSLYRFPQVQLKIPWP